MKKIEARIIKNESTSISAKSIGDTLSKISGIISPPYDPNLLIRFVEQSNILQQCIEAYKTNIFDYGWEIVLRKGLDEKAAESAEAKKEFERMDILFSYGSLDDDMIEEVSKAVNEMEITGNGYLEVIRNPMGEIVALNHIPVSTVRLLSPLNNSNIYRKNVYTQYGEKSFIINKNFYRFVQIGSLNKKVYFKAFGDPNEMNSLTGEYGNYDYDVRANEVIHLKIPSSRTPYGIPRYMGNLLSILGSRKAEELNYYYFENGKHVPLAVIVEGGVLTEGSLENIKEYLKDASGVENAHKVLILESTQVVEEDDEGIIEEEKKNPIKIRLEPLTEILQKDALFVEYDMKNRNKIRSAFRLPPIFTGESEDYNRATAEAAERIGNEQVFIPLRKKVSKMINRKIVNDMQIKFWEFRLKSPNLKSVLDNSQAISPFIENLTFNQVQQFVSENFGLDKIEINEEWTNKPLRMVSSSLPLQKNMKNSLQEILTENLREMRKRGESQI